MERMAAKGRASAGWFRCRARAGRQSPDGQSRRAREGMRCGTAAKTPDDIRDIPVDEADSTRFRSRAWNGHNRARPSDSGNAGKRAAASESMLGEARAGRTGLVSVRPATRAQPSAILTRCCERPMGAHIAAKPHNKQKPPSGEQAGSKTEWRGRRSLALHAGGVFRDLEGEAAPSRSVLRLG